MAVDVIGYEFARKSTVFVHANTLDKVLFIVDEKPLISIHAYGSAAEFNLAYVRFSRIGNNIIVYDFIRPEASRAIVRGQISKINSRIMKQHKLNINVPEEIFEFYFGLANHDEVLEMGGRGIGNLMEDKYINPLAEFIFEADCKEGESINVSVDGNAVKFVKGV